MVTFWRYFLAQFCSDFYKDFANAEGECRHAAEATGELVETFLDRGAGPAVKSTIQGTRLGSTLVIVSDQCVFPEVIHSEVGNNRSGFTLLEFIDFWQIDNKERIHDLIKQKMKLQSAEGDANVGPDREETEVEQAELENWQITEVEDDGDDLGIPSLSHHHSNY
jgi:hypothetical protein